MSSCRCLLAGGSNCEDGWRPTSTLLSLTAHPVSPCRLGRSFQWLKDSLSLRCRTASPFVAHYTCWSDSPNQGTARLSRSARSGRYFDIKTVSTEGLWTSAGVALSRTTDFPV